MPFRAVIRFSLNGDKGQCTTAVSNKLKQEGFEKIGTAAWELVGPDAATICGAIKNVLDIAHLPSSVTSAPAGVEMDHFWLYFENRNEPAGDKVK